MPEVLPKDILLRVGGRTLQRHGVLAVAGSRRGPVEVPITFSRADAATCASYVDAGGLIQRAAAGVIRSDYEPYHASGTVMPDGSPAFGPRLEGSRQNLLLRSEEFDNGAWSATTVTVSANADVAPDGTTTGDRLIEGALSQEHVKYQTLSGTTADVRHASSVFAKKGTRDFLVMTIRDLNSPTGMVIAWFNLNTGAVGTVSNTGVGSGAQAFMVKYPNGWYRCLLVGACNAGDTTPVVTFGVSNANGTQIYTGDGTSYISLWGAQFENNTPIPSNYIKTTTAAVTRAADAFTVPFNFGPIDCTILRRMARPIWADISSLGVNPAAVQISTAVPYIAGNFATAGNVRGIVDGTAADALQETAFPAGALLEATNQFKDLGTSGAAAVDVGAGLTSFVAGATPFTTFGNQTLSVGNQLFGVLVDLVVARGLRSRAEMLAIP